MKERVLTSISSRENSGKEIYIGKDGPEIIKRFPVFIL